MASGAFWCYFRHLSKVGNCFDEWTSGSKASDYESISVSSQNRQHTKNFFVPKVRELLQNSRRSSYGKHGGGEVIFFYPEDPYLASHSNIYMITERLSDLAFIGIMQMQLPLTEAWFVRNLWLCTLNEWRRPHFWTKLLVLLFCGVSRLCNVTVYNSSFPKSPCFGTNIGQLKINQRKVWCLIGFSHPPLKILDPPLL